MPPPHIDSYSFGAIVVNGQHYGADLIILPDRVIAGWWRQEGHLLHAEDLESVFDSRPELLIVGRGAEGRMRVDTGTRRALAAAGIQLIALPTEEACQMYNASCVERITAAALHLTC